jgi:phosphoserine aminotransferase
VREDLIGNVVQNQPILFDYATQANNDSMYNTPSTYPWYVASRVFEWLKEQGGLSAMAKINERKAKTLYKAIDGSDFYSNPVTKRYRHPNQQYPASYLVTLSLHNFSYRLPPQFLDC